MRSCAQNALAENSSGVLEAVTIPCSELLLESANANFDHAHNQSISEMS
jgi:hypothetical protein